MMILDIYFQKLANEASQEEDSGTPPFGFGTPAHSIVLEENTGKNKRGQPILIRLKKPEERASAPERRNRMLLDDYFDRQFNKLADLESEKPLTPAPKPKKKPLHSDHDELEVESKSKSKVIIESKNPNMINRFSKHDGKGDISSEISPPPLRRVYTVLDEYFDGFPLEKAACSKFVYNRCLALPVAA